MKFGEALEIIKQGGIVCFYKEIVLDTPYASYRLDGR